MKWLWLFALTFAAAFSLQTAPRKQTARKPNRAPIIQSFWASDNDITLCPFSSTCGVKHNNEVTLSTNASDPDGDPLTYTYLVPAGSIQGTGSKVVWDLRKGEPGTYHAGVRVEDDKGNKAYAMLTLSAALCTVCDPPPPKCPQVSVDCPSEVESGNLITFTVTVSGGEPLIDAYYRWNTDAGRIVEGKSEKKMTLDLMGFPFEKVTATITVDGYDPACTGTELSCTTRIKQ